MAFDWPSRKTACAHDCIELSFAYYTTCKPVVARAPSLLSKNVWQIYIVNANCMTCRFQLDCVIAAVATRLISYIRLLSWWWIYVLAPSVSWEGKSERKAVKMRVDFSIYFIFLLSLSLSLSLCLFVFCARVMRTWTRNACLFISMWNG